MKKLMDFEYLFWSGGQHCVCAFFLFSFFILFFFRFPAETSRAADLIARVFQRLTNCFTLHTYLLISWLVASKVGAEHHWRKERTGVGQKTTRIEIKLKQLSRFFSSWKNFPRCLSSSDVARPLSSWNNYTFGCFAVVLINQLSSISMWPLSLSSLFCSPPFFCVVWSVARAANQCYRLLFIQLAR